MPIALAAISSSWTAMNPRPVGGIHEAGDDVHGHLPQDPTPRQSWSVSRSGQPRRSAKELARLEDNADDFSKAECDDREIIAAQAERRHTDRETNESGDESTDKQRRAGKAPSRKAASSSPQRTHPPP
jgi:hypothetical protein